MDETKPPRPVSLQQQMAWIRNRSRVLKGRGIGYEQAIAKAVDEQMVRYERDHFPAFADWMARAGMEMYSPGSPTVTIIGPPTD